MGALPGPSLLVAAGTMPAPSSLTSPWSGVKNRSVHGSVCHGKQLVPSEVSRDFQKKEQYRYVR